MHGTPRPALESAAMKNHLLAALALAASCSVVFAQNEKPTEPAQPSAKQPETQPKDNQQEKLHFVQFQTSAGSFILELNREKAPISVDNFLRYVDKGFYDGTIFHRVISDFMIQGGGFDEKMQTKKTDPPIQNEHSNGLKNVRGSISMARTSDPNSGTSQFFINVANNDGTGSYNLDRPPGYAVFGRVVQGMETIDAIKSGEVTTDARGERSKPVSPVVVNKAVRLPKDEAAKLIAQKPEAPKGEPKSDPKTDPKPEGKPEPSKPAAPSKPDQKK
jgi:cyclophilin family peptidyl-prolyl cis-trans isomerase